MSLPHDARAKQRLRSPGAMVVSIAVALACTAYVDARAKLIPKWGQWYAGDSQPFVLLQVRAFLSGRLALVRHPSAAGVDYLWGRGGMHTAWGLGVPILATPFHLIARSFRAPGFPDSLRFLILYAITTAFLVRALRRSLRPTDPNALVSSALAAGFVMVFPTYVGLISARFRIYDQTIATGALWCVLLLSGVLALSQRCTQGRLVAVCAAAGFSILIRPPLAVYGVTTTAIAMLIAQRNGMRPRALLAGLLAYAGVTAIFLGGNALRFGSPFESGFANCISGPFVNRMTRWGLSFAKVPFTTAAKEMFATWFLLEPVPNQITMGQPPASIQPYIVGERWREYYAPTYDLVVLVIWIAALVIVLRRVVRGRLWRSSSVLDGEIATVVGAWALPTSLTLFVFYTRIPNMVTRYAADAYPAFAAAFLCVGMAAVEAVRKRAPPRVTLVAQLAIAGAAALYISGWRGWVSHLSQPIARSEVVEKLEDIDIRDSEMPPKVANTFQCDDPRDEPPVYSHMEDWLPDCSFRSGMVFAMPRSPCVSFTFGPGDDAWGPAEEQSLTGFRANADFDALVRCGTPAVEGDKRRLTMCEPRPPAFLLDGLRLYTIASLDDNLQAIDRLKLLSVDAAPPCP
jgi:hypothetical protein